MNTLRKSAYFFLLVLVLHLASSCRGKDVVAETPDTDIVTEVQAVENPLGFNPDSLRVVEGKVKNGQFFSTLLGSLGMSAQESYNLTQACGDVFDVRTLRVGQTYRAYYDAPHPDPSDSHPDPSDSHPDPSDSHPDSSGCHPDSSGCHPERSEGSLRYLVYDRDKSTCIVFSCQSPYKAWVYEKPITIEKRYADVTINSSLWNDMRAADVSPLLIVSLSDIYAWTIDFFALQKGDRFRVLYEERVCDGEVIAVDTVRYAVFSHDGQDMPMVMFNQGDGGNIWWNEKGESMRKAFLKAPLNYSRISSGFSYSRKHPVTRKVQPHTGVDYAAPTGTPVMTIGDGVVTSVKYEGAGGNTVRIRHNSVYSTAYLHLSKYAKGLKAGQRVRQGEVIGYVGSTGRSTGPHLDFRVWKNGTPINPLKMESPPAEPIKSSNRPAFNQMHEKYKAQIDSIQAQTITVQLLELL